MAVFKLLVLLTSPWHFHNFFLTVSWLSAVLKNLISFHATEFSTTDNQLIYLVDIWQTLLACQGISTRFLADWLTFIKKTLLTSPDFLIMFVNCQQDKISWLSVALNGVAWKFNRFFNTVDQQLRMKILFLIVWELQSIQILKVFISKRISKSLPQIDHNKLILRQPRSKQNSDNNNKKQK